MHSTDDHPYVELVAVRAKVKPLIKNVLDVAIRHQRAQIIASQWRFECFSSLFGTKTLMKFCLKLGLANANLLNSSESLSNHTITSKPSNNTGAFTIAGILITTTSITNHVNTLVALSTWIIHHSRISHNFVGLIPNAHDHTYVRSCTHALKALHAITPKKRSLNNSSAPGRLV